MDKLESKKQKELMEKFEGLEKAAGHIHTDIVFDRYPNSSLHRDIKEDVKLWKDRSFEIYCDIKECHNLEQAEEQMKKIECIIERCYKTYEAKNEFYPAYYIAEGLGDYKRISELCRKACSHYENLENLITAKFFAENLGDAEVIMRIDKKHLMLLEKEGEWAEAGSLAEKIGDLEKAVECYEKGEAWDKAGEIAEKVGKLEKAAEHYEKEALNYKNSRIELGHKGTAEYFEMAGDAAMKAGLEEKARQLYRKAIHSYVDVIYDYAPYNILFIGRYMDAARVADKMGDSKWAEGYREQYRSDKRFKGF